MLYSRVRCAKVGCSYYLKFLAVSENLVDRIQGVRFGQFLVCGLVKIHWNSSHPTLQTHQTAHPCFLSTKFTSTARSFNNKNSRLLHNGRVNKAYVFVISWVFTVTNLNFALLSKLFNHSLTGSGSKQPGSYTESIQCSHQRHILIVCSLGSHFRDNAKSFPVQRQVIY